MNPPKRKNIVCSLRSLLQRERNGIVARGADDRVHIAWKEPSGYWQYLTGMTSRDARLLAKRINEFLDAGG